MTGMRWPRIAAAASGALIFSLGIAGPGAAQARAAGTSAHGELIYVANLNNDPVTAYAAGSAGSVAPSLRLDNPNVVDTDWDPWGVAFDTRGNLYVQSFISDADTFVFPRGAHDNTQPSRIFTGAGQIPDNSSIAVDAQGFEYVLGTYSGTSLAVYAPGASGAPAAPGTGLSWLVQPVRTLTLDGSFNPWPQQLSTDGNEVLAAASRFDPVTFLPDNAIEVFAGGATGGASPLRIISGPDTGLNCAPCKISVTSSTSRIYAAVSDLAGAATRILVFAGNASGDARPLQTIEGAATGLPGTAVTGIAVSPCDGTVYAMVKSSGTLGPLLSTARIDAFARRANGNSPPLRSFTDGATGFADATGIAITSF